MMTDLSISEKLEDLKPICNWQDRSGNAVVLIITNIPQTSKAWSTDFFLAHAFCPSEIGNLEEWLCANCCCPEIEVDGDYPYGTALNTGMSVGKEDLGKRSPAQRLHSKGNGYPPVLPSTKGTLNEWKLSLSPTLAQFHLLLAAINSFLWLHLQDITCACTAKPFRIVHG